MGFSGWCLGRLGLGCFFVCYFFWVFFVWVFAGGFSFWVWGDYLFDVLRLVCQFTCVFGDCLVVGLFVFVVGLDGFAVVCCCFLLWGGFIFVLFADLWSTLWGFCCLVCSFVFLVVYFVRCGWCWCFAVICATTCCLWF